ncbi:MAG: aspartate--tRNA(Asn) ligase [archaeon]
MIRDKYSNEIKVGEDVKIAGWIHDIRDLGKLIFVTIRDREGIVQVTAKGGVTDEKLMAEIKKLGKEWIISVSGKAEKNDRVPNGFEVKPTSIEVISESETPLPLEVTGRIESNLDKRIDWRFLDMRRRESLAVFWVQSEIARAMGEFMANEGFIRIFSSRLTGAATEGGTEYFPILYFNKEAFLAQSPQLSKESVLASGIDKVWEIGMVYRAEPHHTTRHLCEYVSYDLEMVTDDLSDVLDVEERMLKYIFLKLNERCNDLLDLFKISLKFPKNIPRLTFDEANKILKKEGVETEAHDLTPEGERWICKHCEEKYGSSFVFITGFPFAKKPFYIMKDGKKGSFGFDLLYNGLEITSGGIREHRYKERVANIREKGINPDDFDHLRFFKYGMPPHGGLAIGLERLTETILGLENVREASLMPRDPSRLTP